MSPPMATGSGRDGGSGADDGATSDDGNIDGTDSSTDPESSDACEVAADNDNNDCDADRGHAVAAAYSVGFGEFLQGEFQRARSSGTRRNWQVHCQRYYTNAWPAVADPCASDGAPPAAVAPVNTSDLEEIVRIDRGLVNAKTLQEYIQAGSKTGNQKKEITTMAYHLACYATHRIDMAVAGLFDPPAPAAKWQSSLVGITATIARLRQNCTQRATQTQRSNARSRKNQPSQLAAAGKDVPERVIKTAVPKYLNAWLKKNEVNFRAAISGEAFTPIADIDKTIASVALLVPTLTTLTMKQNPNNSNNPDTLTSLITLTRLPHPAATLTFLLPPRSSSSAYSGSRCGTSTRQT